MPELPEVETVRRGLAAALEGRRLARVTVRRRDLRVPLAEGFESRIEGRRVTGLVRRAKYLLVHLDSGDVVIAHLGMSGTFRVLGPGAAEPDAHEHVIFATDDGAEVRFRDPRRFGLMCVAAARDVESHPLLAGLGPEPLGDGFDGPALAARLKGKSGPIKTALLDQGVVAGLGNIYVCESLFAAGISPHRRAGTVKGVRAGRLAAAIRATLSAAIQAGGSTLRDHRRPDGELGYFQHRFAVYDRAGQACPGCTCDVARTGGIARTVQSGRSTFYCARRQR